MSRHIALAIDPLSEEADKTIQWAIDNFFRPTDQIHAVMILILDVEFTDEFESPEIPITDSFEHLRTQATKEKVDAMEAAVKKIKEAGLKVDSRVFKTNPTLACNVLIDYLDTESMDCLVMGSRNLSGWKRFFMGSFSDYVQSHVHCPVLIVK